MVGFQLKAYAAFHGERVHEVAGELEPADALDVPGLSVAVDEFERLMRLQPGIYQASTLTTGLPTLLGGFLTALATAQTIMFLVLGGLLVVALGSW